MPSFRHTQQIAAPPDEVYVFVADVHNLPKYVPTTKSAEPDGPDKVHVQGQAQGATYDADGFFRADPERRHIEWGAEEQDYSGSLDIDSDGDGGSRLTVHLSFSEQMPERVDAEQQAKGEGPPPQAGGPGPDQIQEGLAASLRSIQNHVEGTGGKEEPAGAQPTG